MGSKRTLGVVLFEGFELLDVFGPLEMFGLAADHFEIRLISESGGVVASRQGPKSVCDDSFQSAPAIDVLLVPGGIGTRREVNNPVLLNWLKERSQQAELVASVCTGSALLAKAGVLDGLRATSNKLAFAWAASSKREGAVAAASALGGRRQGLQLIGRIGGDRYGAGGDRQVGEPAGG